MPDPRIALEGLLLACALVLAVPSGVFVAECLLALLPRRDDGLRGLRDDDGPTAVVLVPAHDEETLIGGTVKGLLEELGARDRLVVIADNCTDATADEARAAGAEVIERHDREQRGKGFALAFGIESLSADPPDAVIVVDADCHVSEGAIDRLTRLALELDRPIQADYLIQPPDQPTPLTVVSGFAILVRNRVRPSGLDRIGMPCGLKGSGMAFPWHLIRRARATGDNLVEDLVMGIDLALQGFPPRYCSAVRVTSALPERDEAAASQRRRWEHGQLATLVDRAPELMVSGVARRRASLVALALDLMVPPLALLTLLLLALVSASGLAALLGVGALPLKIALTSLALMAVAVAGAWVRYGADQFPARLALTVPFYVLWKLPLYASLLIGGRQRAWVRTERDADRDC